MEDIYNVKLSKIIDEFKLETLYLPDLPDNILVSCTRVNRPGLQMVGFYDHYEQSRLQIIGKVENLFIDGMDRMERRLRLDDFFRSHTQPSLQFVNLQEACSEQLGEDWGFPQDTQPHLCLSFHTES